MEHNESVKYFSLCNSLVKRIESDEKNRNCNKEQTNVMQLN